MTKEHYLVFIREHLFAVSLVMPKQLHSVIPAKAHTRQLKLFGCAAVCFRDH